MKEKKKGKKKGRGRGRRRRRERRRRKRRRRRGRRWGGEDQKDTAMCRVSGLGRSGKWNIRRQRGHHHIVA